MPDGEAERKPVTGNLQLETASKYFLRYQLGWLFDLAKIKLWEKSRRIGATYVQSYEDVTDIIYKKEYTPGRPVRRVYFSSADESAAREYIEYCAQWAQLFDKGAQELGYVILDSEKDIKALCIEFRNGGKVYALTSNPKRFRSKGGKIVLDEFAHHEDQQAMWKAAYASAMWGYPVRILSTHNGRQCLFFRFVDDCKTGKSGWSLHTVTIIDAVNDGLVDKILGRPTDEKERSRWLDHQRADCRSEEIWQEEFMCDAVDAATAYLPYELIAAAETPDLLMPLFKLKTIDAGDLYAGYDVARNRDLSVFWVVQKLGDVRYTRLIRAFEKTRFAIQMAFLSLLMALPRMRRMVIDKSGMGLPLEEQAREKYGEHRIEGVTFTNAMKETLAVDAKNALEDRRARLPINDTVRESFHSIKRYVTAAGNPRFDADRTDATGHADHFWAFALAEHAAKGSGGPITVASKPSIRDKTDLEGY